MAIDLYHCNLDNRLLRGRTLHPLLTQDEEYRSERFRSDIARDRFRVGRTLIRMVLSRISKTPEKQISIREGENGKPFVESYPDFNLSHSGSLVLLGINMAGSVGVDVEVAKNIVNRDELARRCFSEQEFAAYQSASDADKRQIFYRLWMRKEAFIKGLGAGLRVPLKSFSVSIREHEKNALLCGSDVCADWRNWTIQSMRITHSQEAALAWSGPCSCISIRDATGLLCN